MQFKRFAFFVVLACVAVAAAVFQNCSKIDEKTDSASTFRRYYLVENNYACSMPDGKVIRTYKGKISYDKEQFIFHGDGCSSGAVSFSKTNTSFVATETQITYKGDTYVFMDKEPAFL